MTSIRIILDSCSTVDEAIEILKIIPHSACYNFSLGDTNGKIAIVEASPDNVVVRNGEMSLSCVNHFQDKTLINRNRVSIESSVKRDEHLRDMSSKQMTHLDMFTHFKDKKSPLFFTDYENLFGTLHTLSYSFLDSRIVTTIAQSNQILDFYFEDWVRGENISNQVLIGKIKTE